MKARQVSDGNFKLIPIGMHRAVFTGLVDLGLQPGGMYQPAYKAAIIWHTPDQLTDDGKVMSITQVYTASMHKKSNLRKLVENLFGKAFPDEKTAANFDLKTLLTRACLLNIKHDSKGDKNYANVSSVSPLVQGMEKPVHAGEVLYYSDELPNAEKQAAYAKLPEWLRKKVDEQLQPQAALPAAAAELAREPGSDDDIPW